LVALLDYGGALHLVLLWAKKLCKNGVSVCVRSDDLLTKIWEDFIELIFVCTSLMSVYRVFSQLTVSK
jgi:hypothetical protein